MVNSQFIKDQAIVLFLLGQQVFQPFLTTDFLFLDGLYNVPRGAMLAAGVIAQQLVVFLDLLS